MTEKGYELEVMKGLLVVVTLVLLTRCSESDKLKSTELVNKSAESLIKGDYKLALLQADSAIVYNSENYAAYNNRGVAKTQLKYPFNDTEKDLLRSLELKSDHYTTMSSLMVLYFDNGKYEKVTEYADKYEKLHLPDSSNLCDLIGEAYRVTRNFDKSLYFLNRALELDSTSVTANINIAELNMNTDNYEMALSYLKRAEELGDERPNIIADINIDLSVTNYVLGRIDSALIYVNRALKFKPRPILYDQQGCLPDEA